MTGTFIIQLLSDPVLAFIVDDSTKHSTKHIVVSEHPSEEIVMSEHPSEEMVVSEQASEEIVVSLNKRVTAEAINKPGQCPLSLRKAHMDAYCAKHHPGKAAAFLDGGFVGTFVSERLVVDDVHKIIFCPIPKVGVTTWNDFFKKVLGFPAPGWTKELNGTKKLMEYTPEEAKYRLKNYLKVMVARHPIDRLVSAYNDKFLHMIYKEYLRPLAIDTVRHGITNIPQADYVTFFHPGGKPRDPILKEHVRNYDRYINPLEEGNPYRVNFTEFLAFISHHEEDRNKHWELLDTMSSPCDVNYDVILKVETIDRDSQYVIKKMADVASIRGQTRLPDKHSLRKVETPVWNPNLVEGYIQQALSDNTKSPIKPWVMRELPEYNQVPRDLIIHILKQYWDDMIMFGYDFNMDQKLTECSFEHEGSACC